jgi:hypothetical protein
VLAYSFTENRQFPAKIHQNSIFHSPDPHISDRIYLMVMYMSFYGFSKKIKISLINSIGVTLQFYQKSSVCGKTDRNSIFDGCDPHIRDCLYLMAAYMSFYWFLKNSKFPSTSIGVSLRFYQKSPVCGKNWLKLHILCSWPPYSWSAILNGLVYEFLETPYFVVVTPIFRIECT